jgi:tetratricopeptide (TPR) repeat protein
MDDLEKMAAEYPSWETTLHYARGEYQRIRGDYPRALKELQKALKLSEVGRHPNWAYLAGAYIRTMTELGRFQEAETQGRQFIQAAQKEELDAFLCNYIRMPLAVAEARQGKYENAVRTAGAAINIFKELGSTGLNLGLAYEARARVATLMNDNEQFQSYATLCAEQYKTGGNPALFAKYEKLIQEAHRFNLSVSTDVARAIDLTDLTNMTALNQIDTLLAACSGAKERAERILDLLIKGTNCIGGFLYTVQKDGPVLSAQVGKEPPSAQIDTMARKRIASELEDKEDFTQAGAREESAKSDTTGWTGYHSEEYRSVVLGHMDQDRFAVTGLAVLCTDPNKAFQLPGRELHIISKFLFGSGDVAKVYASD